MNANELLNIFTEKLLLNMNYDAILQSDRVLKDMVDYLQMCQALFWVLVVINVIVLIAFFVLCNNIGKIKKTVCTSRKFGAVFNFYYSIGELEKAKECLFHEVANDEFLDEAFFTSAEYNQKMRKYFQDKYQVYFDRLGIKIDYDKADELIKEVTD